MWPPLLVIWTVLTTLTTITTDAKWTLVWSDEFNEAAGTKPDSRKWNYHIGNGAEHGNPGWGNAELQYYTDSVRNVAQDGKGSLVITARRERAAAGHKCHYGPCQYTSARLYTKGKFAHRYGRFEVRLKAPAGKGLWPAFWMLGDDHSCVGWPQCGEIDIMEMRGSQPHMVSGALHLPGLSGGAAASTGWYAFPDKRSFAEDFYTFAVEWKPDVITWYVDGVAYGQKTSKDLKGNPWVFDHPFYILLNLAVGGHFDGNPDLNTSFPQSLVVDYVRVYDIHGGDADAVLKKTIADKTTTTEQNRLGPASDSVAKSSVPVTATSSPRSPFILKLEAERADDQVGTSTKHMLDGGNDDQIVSHIGDGDMLVFRRVNFKSGANFVQIRYASGVRPGITGIVRFHLDQPTSQYFSLFGLGTTDGWQKWKTISGTVSPTPTGIHDLYVVFQSDFDDCFASINWFMFTEQAP